MASSHRQQPTDRKDPSPLGLTPTQPSLTEEVKKSAVANDNLEELEAEITCPIKGAVFFDPVIVTCCGKTYEEEGIHEWLVVKQNCPDCRAPLDKSKLLKNRALKNTCDKLTKLHPALAAKQYFSMTLLEKYLFYNKDSEELDRIVRGLIANPESLNHINEKGVSAVTTLCRTTFGIHTLSNNKLLRDAINENALNFRMFQQSGANPNPVAFLIVDPTGRKLLTQDDKLRGKISPEGLMPDVCRDSGKVISLIHFLLSSNGRELLQFKDLRSKITAEMLTTFTENTCALGCLLYHYDLKQYPDLLDKITPESLLVPYPSGPFKNNCCLFLLVIGDSESTKLLMQYKTLRSKITAKSLLTRCYTEIPTNEIILKYFVRLPDKREALKLILKENPQVRKDLLQILSPIDQETIKQLGISLQDPEAKQEASNTSVSQSSLLAARGNTAVNTAGKGKENPMRPSK